VLSSHALSGHEPLILAIVCALLIGKPAGLVIASVLAVRLGVASKPDEYSWRQLVGAGALAGIGFTMSLFIATQALPDPSDFAAAKIAVFAGSILSAVVAVAILWNADRQTQRVVTTPEMMHAADESRQRARQVTLQGSA
jgi:Na+:H+ antiporter, NhaA family